MAKNFKSGYCLSKVQGTKVKILTVVTPNLIFEAT